MSTITDDVVADARLLGAYTKQYGAGAFASPSRADLAKADRRITEDAGGRTVVVTRRLTRESIRKDFTGEPYSLSGGWTVATHVARTETGPMPDLTGIDVVTTYVEDVALTSWLEREGWEPMAHNVTAAGAILWTWARFGRGLRPVDRVTVTEVDLQVPAGLRQAMLDEVVAVDGWDDDYPFYSDGSWSGLSLRGFWPDDPTRGVKPSEMSKAWKAEHPDDLARTCDWTTLADQCPTMREWVDSIPFAGDVERVRLLRMDGRQGSRLDRHTDITDKAHGTRDGQIARIHVPIRTHPDIVLSAWDLRGRRHDVHLAAWRAWYLDARKPHAVTNPTDVDRVHLVIDLVANQAVRDALLVMDAVA